MSEISPSATAPDLVACAHCGVLDSGTFCSACGKPLAAEEHKPVLLDAWELLVTDRLGDLREFATTTGLLVAKPSRFFRTVMERPAARASHVFPEPVPERLAGGAVQRPFKFIVLSLVALLLANKAINAPGSELIEGLGGLGEDVNNELMLLMLLGYLSFYGLLFHYSTGRRISVEEAVVFNGYLTGVNLSLMAVMTLVPERFGLTLIGLLAAIVYVGLVLPHVVLPRLYGITRKRVLLAQGGAALGAVILLGTSIQFITFIAGGVRGVLGI